VRKSIGSKDGGDKALAVEEALEGAKDPMPQLNAKFTSLKNLCGTCRIFEAQNELTELELEIAATFKLCSGGNQTKYEDGVRNLGTQLENEPCVLRMKDIVNDMNAQIAVMKIPRAPLDEVHRINHSDPKIAKEYNFSMSVMDRLEDKSEHFMKGIGCETQYHLMMTVKDFPAPLSACFAIDMELTLYKKEMVSNDCKMVGGSLGKIDDCYTFMVNISKASMFEKKQEINIREFAVVPDMSTIFKSMKRGYIMLETNPPPNTPTFKGKEIPKPEKGLKRPAGNWVIWVKTPSETPNHTNMTIFARQAYEGGMYKMMPPDLLAGEITDRFNGHLEKLKLKVVSHFKEAGYSAKIEERSEFYKTLKEIERQGAA